MQEQKIGDIIKFKRSNGVITIATVCFIDSEFVGVSWFEGGKKFGKLVSQSEIIKSPKKIQIWAFRICEYFLFNRVIFDYCGFFFRSCPHF